MEKEKEEEKGRKRKRKAKGRGGVLPRQARKEISEKNPEIGGVLPVLLRVLRTLTFVLKKIVLCP